MTSGHTRATIININIVEDYVYFGHYYNMIESELSERL